jgi:hypothetical protein
MNAKLNESNPNEIMGYEPYFGKDVITGFICGNSQSKCT